MEKKTLFIALLCVLLGEIRTNVFAQYIPIPIFKDPPTTNPQDLGSGVALRLSVWYSEDSVKIEVNRGKHTST